MEEKELYELTNRFKQSETVKALDRYFSEKSMMEILGVDRDENSHSKFLGWLFGNCQTGPLAVKFLLQTIYYPPIEIQHIDVILEDYLKIGDKIGRADIVLLVTYKDNKAYKQLRIVIENKVRSKEHDNQTDTYYEYYKGIGCETIYFFLAPYQPKNNIINQSFIWITYQCFLDRILLSVRNSALEHQQRIDEYIRALGINYTQETIMAASPILKALVNSLWNDYQQLWNCFKTPMLGIVHDELVELWNSHNKDFGANFGDIIRLLFKALCIFNDSDDIKNINNLLNPIDRNENDKSKKNYSEYQIGSDSFNKNGLVLHLVKLYIERKGNSVTLEKLQETFPYYLQAKTSSALYKAGSGYHQVVISNELYEKIEEFNPKTNKAYKKNPKNRWNQLSVGNGFVYVHQDGWDGSFMMSRLIKYVKESIPELSRLEILEIPRFLQKAK